MSDNRCFDTSIIEAVKVEHDYGTIMVPESDQNRSENRTLIVSESLTLTVTIFLQEMPQWLIKSSLTSFTVIRLNST